MLQFYYTISSKPKTDSNFVTDSCILYISTFLYKFLSSTVHVFLLRDVFSTETVPYKVMGGT